MMRKLVVPLVWHLALSLLLAPQQLTVGQATEEAVAALAASCRFVPLLDILDPNGTATIAAKAICEALSQG